MDLVQIGLVIVGLVSGLVIGFLLAKLKFSGQSEDGEKSKLSIALQVEQERYTRLTSDLESINKQLREEREKVILLNNRNAGLESDHRNLQERLQDQKKEIASLQEQFSAQFKNLANEIFDEKSKKFTDQNKTNLFDLLKPLGDKLTDFEKKVEATNKESLERNATLRQEILHLRELNNKMTQEAENLTKALKGDSRIQGDWGEIVLERILEQSGLEKDREYFLQESLKSEAGRRLRPDVIIRLPDSRNLVIDAKASLTAYERYMNTDDEEEKSAHLKDHLLSVKTHIKTLSEKSYQQLFDGGALDYVIMFVPIESAFALIVQHGGELYNEAHHKNIIIVSPATLIATLRTVASIWKHEYQNRNALEIARQGGALYDKFKSFVDDLVEVGKS
ncbi:MAG: DNA recombination protein RmuC, partial [Cyclobacteriaceae bacterium]|nr:DNA recombination protein RmuC [Cyclobacteriaceae bacterium HetDA_MAG_MS6]